jgi:hypothetical protein
MQKQSINSIIISTLMILLSACGGGESDGSFTSSSTQTAISVSSTNITLMDAGAISGLKVMCGSTELVTDASGVVECQETPITVYLGEFKLGDVNSIPVDRLIYMQELLHLTRGEIAYPEVAKLSMILQSLDKDAYPLNGITLDSNVIDLLGSYLNASTILEDLSFDDVENIINDVIQAALSQDSSSKLQAVDYHTAQSNLATSVAGEI